MYSIELYYYSALTADMKQLDTLESRVKCSQLKHLRILKLSYKIQQVEANMQQLKRNTRSLVQLCAKDRPGNYSNLHA